MKAMRGSIVSGRSSSWIVLSAMVAAAWLVGCGSSSQTAKPVASAASSPAATAAGEVADGKHLTDFQRSRLLGHYSTEDGKSGFVLDRTGPKPKARLDGSQTVEVLEENVSSLGTPFLESKNIWLRLYKDSGEVELFQGPTQKKGVPVVRDADAEPLP